MVGKYVGKWVVGTIVVGTIVVIFANTLMVVVVVVGLKEAMDSSSLGIGTVVVVAVAGAAAGKPLVLLVVVDEVDEVVGAVVADEEVGNCVFDSKSMVLVGMLLVGTSENDKDCWIVVLVVGPTLVDSRVDAVETPAVGDSVELPLLLGDLLLLLVVAAALLLLANDGELVAVGVTAIALVGTRVGVCDNDDALGGEGGRDDDSVLLDTAGRVVITGVTIVPLILTVLTAKIKSFM